MMVAKQQSNHLTDFHGEVVWPQEQQTKHLFPLLINITDFHNAFEESFCIFVPKVIENLFGLFTIR